MSPREECPEGAADRGRGQPRCRGVPGGVHRHRSCPLHESIADKLQRLRRRPPSREPSGGAGLSRLRTAGGHGGDVRFDADTFQPLSVDPERPPAGGKGTIRQTVRLGGQDCPGGPLAHEHPATVPLDRRRHHLLAASGASVEDEHEWALPARRPPSEPATARSARLKGWDVRVDRFRKSGSVPPSPSRQSSTTASISNCPLANTSAMAARNLSQAPTK